MNTSLDKASVFKGIIAAWFAGAAFIGGLYFYTPQPSGLSPFTIWGASISIPILCLIIGIALAARHRHFVSHIDGSPPEAGSRLDIILRYNQNTQEQIIVFAGASALACALIPEIAMGLMPIMSLWFGIMRAAFYQGYKRRPVLRAFGFAGTFHPSVILFLGALIYLIARHF